jgi:hypothetical protein
MSIQENSKLMILFNVSQTNGTTLSQPLEQELCALPSEDAEQRRG